MNTHTKVRSKQGRLNQEVPLQRRRSTTRTPQTKHGVVHRNHRKSTPQTRQRRARSRREARHESGANAEDGHRMKNSTRTLKC